MHSTRERSTKRAGAHGDGERGAGDGNRTGAFKNFNGGVVSKEPRTIRRTRLWGKRAEIAKKMEQLYHHYRNESRSRKRGGGFGESSGGSQDGSERDHKGEGEGNRVVRSRVE